MRAGRERVTVALAGTALLLLGVLGFVPGVTSHLGDLALAGRSSHALLFGTFRVSVLANLVHAALGAAGLVWARQERDAGEYLVAAAVACLGLWALGTARYAGWLPASTDDNYLHFSLGLLLLAASALARGSGPAGRAQAG